MGIPRDSVSSCASGGIIAGLESKLAFERLGESKSKDSSEN